MNRKLIFVYNVDSSLFAQVTGYVHKALKPETYACNLCKLTYSNIGMKKEWKKFIESLPLEVEFLHRDEFKKLYPNNMAISCPAVFWQTNVTILLLGKEDINKIHDLRDLKHLILNKLNSSNKKAMT